MAQVPVSENEKGERPSIQKPDEDKPLWYTKWIFIGIGAVLVGLFLYYSMGHVAVAYRTKGIGAAMAAFILTFI